MATDSGHSIIPVPTAHPDLCRALGELSSSVTKAKGSILFQQGETPTGVYVLRRGKVVFLLERGGTPIAFRIALPGAVLGLPALVGSSRLSLTAEITEDAELGFVPRKALVSLLRQDQAMCLHALDLLGREVQEMRRIAAKQHRSDAHR